MSIVTRQRPKKKFKIRSLLLPVVALLAIAFALWWPPSRARIVGFVVNGPLTPVWHLAANVISPFLQPLHFAAQEQVIADRNKQIETLNGQIDDQRKEINSRDAQIAALQNQIKAQQAAAARAAAATPTPVAVRRPSASAAPGVETASTQVQLTDDPKRIAAVWSTMEPEQAAAVAQKLPPTYTARVLALMGSDAAGSLLGALPPTYAAQVSQISTQVPK
ncbi:MAG: hypothetical protein JO359_12380 [Candidatus Eremiobacteraeota bacterium]|nr:hypothetical protein [Candidatus Eremiobacteraeota bacterium]